MIVYLYDLKSSVRNYNRLKRVFYYNLHRNGLGRFYWKTKSVIVVPKNMERPVDRFFKEYTKFCVVYKIRCRQIERLE
ncbi:MAG: hypothetical protein AB1657_04440 [Candidatus Micrarchaeota archaeon]